MPSRTGTRQGGRALDRHARAFLEVVEAAGRPSFHTLSPSEARKQYKEARRFSQPDAPKVASSAELEIEAPHATIPIRAYRPLGAAPTEALPALVFFHGGGWTIGDLDTHDVLCRQLANGARCALFAVDYRLGPEHKFPAAVDDAVFATKWMAENTERFHIDPERIAVGGDSAGGNLAAVVALSARDAGSPRIVFQLLIYPATDQYIDAPSHFRNGTGYLLTREAILYFRGNYLNGPQDYDDWRASPLRARELSKLPPAFILTAGFDPIVDEGSAYADRLRAAGVPVEYVCFESQIHGFITMGRVIPQANEAVNRCAKALASAFATAARSNLA
jgi:acetyl esterase